MEKRNALTQRLMFENFLLFSVLAIVGTIQGEGDLARHFQIAIWIVTGVGLVVFWAATFYGKIQDFSHGILYMVLMGVLVVFMVSYRKQALMLNFLLLLVMLMVSIYRNFRLCEFMLLEMVVILFLELTLFRHLGFGVSGSRLEIMLTAVGTLGGSIVLACVIGTEEKNRRVILENRLTSQDMLRLVQMKKEEAEHLADVKTNFLANMSHEIRTPINAVLGMNEMILRECGQEEILEYARNIDRAGKTLLSLIGDILDISKIESGKVEITPGEYELGTVINDLLNLVQVKAEEKGLEIKCEIAQDIPCRLYGDDLRLKQILANILGNAVKYTNQGSIQFHLDWEKLGNNEILMKFCVQDTGVGMKEEEVEHIFETFHRLDLENNRSIEGSGLGMAIAGRFLELMHGSISIDSEYGVGTKVQVEIPQQVRSWKELRFESKRMEKKEEPKKYQASFVAPQARILVVDDNVMNLSVIKGLLKRTNMQVDLVESGMEAIDAVQREYYDLILMDHMMPQMDGIETMYKIKRLLANKNPDVPMIALTANATVGSKEMYLDLGFNDYLAKPVKGEELERMLCAYLPECLVEKREIPTEEESKWEIPQLAALLREYGLDLKEGLDYVNGDMDQYLDAAEVFLRNSKKKRAQMRTLLENDDLPAYTIEVHALKSNGRILGSRELENKAKEMEQWGNEDRIGDVRRESDALEEIWLRTEMGLNHLEEKIGPREETIKPGAGMDEEAFRQEKQKLAEWIRNYEEDVAVETVDALLRQGLNEEQMAELNTIKELLEDFSYEQALEYLEG